MITDIAKLSLRNLARRGKRSWLTIIGIVIGITVVVALFSLGQGLEQSVTQEFEDLGANTVYVLAGEGIQGFFAGGDNFDEDDLEAVRRARGVDEAGPMIYSQEVGEFRGQEERVPLVGVPTDSSQEAVMAANALEVATGRNIRGNDLRAGLAGSDLADGEIFDREVGQNSQIDVAGETIRIVGILEPTGDPEYDRSVVVPLESARDILGEEDRSDYIVVRVMSGQDPGEVANEIEEELRIGRNVQPGDEDFTVSTADDLIETFTGILTTVQYVVLGIVSIALFVGGLGIMNTMYMSVSERTKEIGIMKALGAQKKQILGIYLVEAGVLGLIGGILGVVIGLGLSEIAFYFIRGAVDIPISPARSPFVVGGALVTGFVLGLVSGLLPARKAANLEPVEAIREG